MSGESLYPPAPHFIVHVDVRSLHIFQGLHLERRMEMKDETLSGRDMKN